MWSEAQESPPSVRVILGRYGMRLGILSDIHANYEALSAVIEAYKQENVDQYYCLGDTVGYGGSPNECSDLVRNLVVATILGNHDAAVAGRMDYSYYYEAARHALDLHAQLLSAENMAWLKGLPYQIKLDDLGVQLCHGSPVRLEEFEYIFAPEQARECLPIYESLGQITLIGHSHLCKVFALTPTSVEELPPIDFDLQPDRKYIVSVGSVGQPRDYDNRASFTVYDTTRKRFEFKRIEYDIETAADKVLRAKLERNFAHRLFIGV
jgi:predicted phosphodiesterase